jgi:creatinine amidohydrolase
MHSSGLRRPIAAASIGGTLHREQGMANEVEWARLTAPELRAIAARDAALAILPVGSLEQHGPHLPVITDTRTAFEIGLRAARLVVDDVPVAVMPGMWTGMSEHHLPFGGTISLDYSEFHGVLRGVVRSLRALGFARLLIVNGHGGNVDPLAVSARTLAQEYGLPVIATTPWFSEGVDLTSIMETAPTAQHACEGETSVMLAMVPDLVRRDRIDEAVQQAPPGYKGRRGYSRFWAFNERAPVTGTIGDPRAGTAEKGERLLDMMATAVADAIRDRDLWRKPDPVWSPGRGQGSTAP